MILTCCVPFGKDTLPPTRRCGGSRVSIVTHFPGWFILTSTVLPEKWPRTATGLPSTAGTTATVAFIRHGKMYIGHVGDSGIVLGYQEQEGSMDWKSRPLTQDHKPECDIEKSRIMSSGGKVVAKSGVSRVVWTRPRLGHKGPIRRSTPIDEIPFLAVARSLGDLWSFNSQRNEFVVSPEPDVHVIKIDKNFRCLIFGTDGLWNVLSPHAAVDIVRNAEFMNDRNSYYSKELLNPSRKLVNRALEKWSTTRIRADNTSVVTILLDPPGGPKRKQFPGNMDTVSATTSRPAHRPMKLSDFYPMEEKCLSNSGEKRHRKKRLTDYFPESLYKHTHQYNGLEVMGGGSSGVDDSFHMMHSPSTSFAAASHSNYENYMNLQSPPVSTHHHHQHHQPYPRLPPPGGFLQSHLQGNISHSFNYGSDYDQHSQHSHNSGGGGSDNFSVSIHEADHQLVQSQPPTYGQQQLPTFSHLVEDTLYSLTRLETRLEQLTHSATGNSSMYANYQQLIETTNNYSPQVDLDAINTFHDYAGFPLVPPQNKEMAESYAEDAVASTGSICDQLSYAMDHEKFAWSQEWHGDSGNLLPVQETPQEAPYQEQNVPAVVVAVEEEIPTSSTSAGEAVEENSQRNSEEPAREVASSIQINEITSSGVVPTPPPTVAQAVSPKTKTDSVVSVKLSPKVTEKVDRPRPVDLKRQLRCHSTIKEKENKSQEPEKTNKRLRLSTKASSVTLNVATRSTSTTCISTRKATTSAIKSALRQVAVVVPAPAGKEKSDRLAGKRGNLLIPSRKFNQQKCETKEEPTTTTVLKAVAAAVKPEVARRLSKRDKVRNKTTISTVKAKAPQSWRKVTKSTVQTRNRVQKR